MKTVITFVSWHSRADQCRVLADLGHEVKSLTDNSREGNEGLNSGDISADITVDADILRSCNVRVSLRTFACNRKWSEENNYI